MAIVNATGLCAYELAGDKTVSPLRGALIRVINDGTKFPKVTEALCVTHDDNRGEDDIVFIGPFPYSFSQNKYSIHDLVPRNDNVSDNMLATA